MKIGFDAKRAVSNRTGLGNYSRSLVQHLAAFHPEHDYHLFSPSADTTLLDPMLTQQDHVHLHKSKARIKSYWRSFSIVKDLQQTGIQLYHGLSNELPYGMERSGIKSVVTIHDLIFKVHPETYGVAERMIYDRKFRHACAVADRIVAISEHTKNDIVRFYGTDPERISVIYQSCRDHFYHRRSEAELVKARETFQLPESYFLYVGTVEARKNLKSVIAAYEQGLREKQIPLVVVGRGGPYADTCKAAIRQAGLEHLFIWKENVHDSLSLQAIFQMATALIYPSSYEGFGLPVAEALLSGTAVITSSQSSLPEAAGPDAYYIDPARPESIITAASSILDDPAQALSRTKKGAEYVRARFDPAALTDRMVNCYLSVSLER